MKHKWMLRLATGALVMTCLGGVALAAGQQGTQNDPLVTLSYLTDQATPAILAQVAAKITQREQELADKLGAVVDGYVKQVEDKLATGGITGGGQSASYQVVTLSQGQKLICKAGGEVLLRSGTASCVTESSPGLVDMTDGTTLGAGGALAANHLYLATVDGRGVSASGAVTLLVRGGYSIQ